MVNHIRSNTESLFKLKLSCTGVFFTLLILATIVLPSGLALAAKSALDSIEVQLLMPAKEFRYGQDVFVEVTVVNFTADSLAILLLSHPRYLKIFDENNEIVSIPNVRITTSGVVTQTLAPHDTLRVSRPIHAYYYSSNDPAKRPASYMIGKHALTAEFGDHISNVVTYEVVPNESPDNGIVEVLAYANRSWFEPQLHERIISQVESILVDNPNTAYKPELLSTLARFARFRKNFTLATEINRRLVDECPNHMHALSALSKLVQEMTPEKKSVFLDSVSTEHSNTRASEWARQYRKSMGR